MRWVYSNYLDRLFDSAKKSFEKSLKRISDRMSDVGRKPSQSIRQ